MEFDLSSGFASGGESTELQQPDLTELSIVGCEAILSATINYPLDEEGFWGFHRTERARVLSHTLIDMTAACLDQGGQSIEDTVIDALSGVVNEVALAMETSASQSDDSQIGRELAALTSEACNDQSVLHNVEQVISLLTSFGLHELYRYGKTGQLAVAVGLITTFIERVPNFDSLAAGYDDARGDLIITIAALRLDSMHRSDTADKIATRSVLLDRLYTQLGQLDASVPHTDFLEGDSRQ